LRTKNSNNTENLITNFEPNNLLPDRLTALDEKTPAYRIHTVSIVNLAGSSVRCHSIGGGGSLNVNISGLSEVASSLIEKKNI